MRLASFQKFLWSLVGIAALLFVGLLLWTEYRADWVRGEERVPAFRADFELTDHTGIVRTEEDFAGRWLLVFFGFANCPDICPTTLAEVAAVVDGLGAQSEAVQPLFISVDPERDTPASLADYVPRFDAGIIGLTGTPDQVTRTAESFHVYYEKIVEAAAPDGYTMAHSSQLLLFDPAAGFVTTWPYGTSSEDILTDLRRYISE